MASSAGRAIPANQHLPTGAGDAPNLLNPSPGRRFHPCRPRVVDVSSQQSSSDVQIRESHDAARLRLEQSPQGQRTRNEARP